MWCFRRPLVVCQMNRDTSLSKELCTPSDIIYNRIIYMKRVERQKYISMDLLPLKVNLPCHISDLNATLPISRSMSWIWIDIPKYTMGNEDNLQLRLSTIQCWSMDENSMITTWLLSKFILRPDMTAKRRRRNLRSMISRFDPFTMIIVSSTYWRWVTPPAGIIWPTTP